MKKNWIATSTVMGSALLLGACASHSPATTETEVSQFEPRVRCLNNIEPEHIVELEMVDTLMARGRNFAALAKLQGVSQENQEYWQRYGELLAKIGDLDQAALVFETLKERCNSGEAYHGLGMVALKSGDLTQALSHFDAALALMPASSAVRNDYGYALMLAGKDDAAELHLRTALELENGKGKARQNLAIAYYLSGNEKGLERLRNEYGYSTEELCDAERNANLIRR